MVEDIKEGDIVCLKSGGPYMTVKRICASADSVECMWFTKKASVKSAIFLKKVLCYVIKLAEL